VRIISLHWHELTNLRRVPAADAKLSQVKMYLAFHKHTVS
jgi:hypothetical protein